MPQIHELAYRSDLTESEGRELGRLAFDAWQTSSQLRALCCNPRPIDAIRVFMPPVYQGETKMMVSRPLPAAYVAFINGWNSEESKCTL